MNGHYVRALAVAACAAIFAACSGGATNSTLPTGTTGGTAGAMALGNGTMNAQQVCSAVNLRPGYARCFAWIRTDVIPNRMHPDAGSYGPSDLQTAYNLPSSTNGTGQIVGIVDAFGYPNAESDLGAYRSHYGLSACTTANGCFKKVNQTGGTTYPPTNSGWDGEQALDVDMVSAICPNCHIVLVEATDNSFNNLGIAEKQAFTQGAGQVEQLVRRRRVQGHERQLQARAHGYRRQFRRLRLRRAAALLVFDRRLRRRNDPLEGQPENRSRLDRRGQRLQRIGGQAGIPKRRRLHDALGIRRVRSRESGLPGSGIPQRQLHGIRRHERCVADHRRGLRARRQPQ